MPISTIVKTKRDGTLTFADLGATNPKLWNSWQDMLLSELYTLTVDSFERGETGAIGGLLAEGLLQHHDLLCLRVATTTK